MTGNPPFTGDNISSVYSKIKAVDYKFPAYFSKELRKLFSKLLVRDPKLRADMDMIRRDEWVNFEEAELPIRITPKIVGNAEPSQIGQFISSIHHDQAFVIYTFQSHLMDVNRITSLKKQSLKMQSKANADTPIVNIDEIIRTRAGSVQIDSAQPRASIAARGRRMSVQSSINPTLNSPQLSVPISTATNAGNFATASGFRAKRRNTLTSATNGPLSLKVAIEVDDSISSEQLLNTNLNSHSRPPTWNPSITNGNDSKSLSPTSPSSSSTLQIYPISKTRRRRNTETSLNLDKPGLQISHDRDFNVLRRMSQVGPTTVSEVKIVSDMTKNARRNTGTLVPQPPYVEVGSDEQTINISMLRTKRIQPLFSSGPEDLDPMQDVEIVNEIKEVEASEITTEEIEKWHLLHKPPKQIRTVRFNFNSNTTSSAAPFLVFQEVTRALMCIQKMHDNNLKFTRPNDLYLLACSLNSTVAEDRIEFEVEVCKLWLMKVHGVRIKRISGNPFIYKDVYSTFVSLLQF
ncbi:Serine/threonine-protein kinase par-1 [Nowakowskiella sp. JEL0078]|nr:Serine/threonine-protein kinase par-1 [Nowakowskiella sp. JEL0078]